jgi:hypothetical protein
MLTSFATNNFGLRLTIPLMYYRNLSSKPKQKVVLTVSRSQLLTYTMEDIVVMGARFH